MKNLLILIAIVYFAFAILIHSFGQKSKIDLVAEGVIECVFEIKDSASEYDFYEYYAVINRDTFNIKSYNDAVSGRLLQCGDTVKVYTSGHVSKSVIDCRYYEDKMDQSRRFLFIMSIVSGIIFVIMAFNHEKL